MLPACETLQEQSRWWGAALAFTVTDGGVEKGDSNSGKSGVGQV